MQTPALLQLSGIGPPALLSALGIPVTVPLDGVGRNLQEQPAVTTEANTTLLDTGGTRIADAMVFPGVRDVFAGGALANASVNVTRAIAAGVDAWAAAEAQKGGAVSKEALRAVYEVQAATIVSNKGALRIPHRCSHH